MSLLSILCLLLLTAAPAWADSEEAAKPASVNLAFSWEPGLEATVSTTKTRLRDAGEQTKRSATSSYAIRVAADGEDLRIQFSDPSFEMSGDLEALPAQARAQLAAQIAELMPDYVVKKSGEFSRIHDLPAYQKRLEVFIDELMPKDIDPGLLAQFRAIFTSEGFLTGKAAEQWNTIVGVWAGAEFEFGEVYGYSNREPIPAFPGELILMNYEFSAKRLVPCRRAGKDRQCAEVEMRSTTDPEDTKKLIESMLSRLAGGEMPPIPPFKTLEVMNTIHLVTEPDGLVPHAYTVTRTMQGTIEIEGQVQSVQQVEETRVEYTYP